jgi:plasmid stabilization system protein ParE
MTIIETPLFKEQRDRIIVYIVNDKKSAGLKFAKDLKICVNKLLNFPYKFRQSYYYEDENIRDMTFNGYSIIYRVNQEKDVIEILEIFNRNLPRLDDTHDAHLHLKL